MEVTIIGDVAVIKRVCPFCGVISEIHVPRKGYEAWRDGELVQKAFPELTAENREFLITGMCRDCQAGIFGEEE